MSQISVQWCLLQHIHIFRVQCMYFKYSTCNRSHRHSAMHNCLLFIWSSRKQCCKFWFQQKIKTDPNFLECSIRVGFSYEQNYLSLIFPNTILWSSTNWIWAFLGWERAPLAQCTFNVFYGQKSNTVTLWLHLSRSSNTPQIQIQQKYSRNICRKEIASQYKWPFWLRGNSLYFTTHLGGLNSEC